MDHFLFASLSWLLIISLFSYFQINWFDLIWFDLIVLCIYILSTNDIKEFSNVLHCVLIITTSFLLLSTFVLDLQTVNLIKNKAKEKRRQRRKRIISITGNSKKKEGKRNSLNKKKWVSEKRETKVENKLLFIVVQVCNFFLHQ